MSNKNYRGRYEGDGDIDMVANRSKTMGFFGYSKFWVAIIGFGLTAVTGFTGIDFSMFGITPEAIIGFLTAVGVWGIPNSKEA